MIFEVKGDVFTAPFDYALAHCISADAAMSKGFALECTLKYPGIVKLRSGKNKVGTVVPLSLNNRRFYNLVTKSLYWSKPEIGVLQACLFAVRNHAMSTGLKNICMPKIGTGLDKFDYQKQVLPCIKVAFANSGINIWVYSIKEPLDR